MVKDQSKSAYATFPYNSIYPQIIIVEALPHACTKIQVCQEANTALLSWT